MPEQDNSFASASVPEVQNKAPKPPGIMPKNAPTWVVLAIAVLVICVIGFSGGGSAPKSKEKDRPAQNANMPTQRRIDDYKALVDEESRRLAQERQRLDQLRAEADAAKLQFQQQHQVSPTSDTSYRPTAYERPQLSPEEQQRIALQNDRRKKDYASLFASNIALSYRKAQVDSATPERTAERVDSPASENPIASLERLGQQLRQIAQTARPNATSRTQVANSKEPEEAQHERASEPARQTAADEKRTQQSDDPQLQLAEGKKHRLFEGAILETVLTNRIDAAFSGPVNAMVTTNVYSHDRQSLLIPQGTRILGEVQKVSTFGQQRVAVFFHRLIMPDGYSVSLDQFKGLNQIGETGLRDKVDRHYLQIFGASIAVGAIAGVAQANTRYGIDASGLDAYRQGFASTVSLQSLRILDRFLNILPTFTIREGHRIKVHLTNDLLLPAYDQHRLPSDL